MHPQQSPARAARDPPWPAPIRLRTTKLPPPPGLPRSVRRPETSQSQRLEPHRNENVATPRDQQSVVGDQLDAEVDELADDADDGEEPGQVKLERLPSPDLSTDPFGYSDDAWRIPYERRRRNGIKKAKCYGCGELFARLENRDKHWARRPQCLPAHENNVVGTQDEGAWRALKERRDRARFWNDRNREIARNL
ncbi:hypothetical protein AURDEDRAFT_128012 [Auricularia subglabra TFB-10046 SS5]|nr:hypothetical protein AURDEDRAFT_128012 [Auricularia subglabra TFB-10046 SS5]